MAPQKAKETSISKKRKQSTIPSAAERRKKMMTQLDLLDCIIKIQLVVEQEEY